MTNDHPQPEQPDINWQSLSQDVVSWTRELGFDACGITDVDVVKHHARLNSWLSRGYQGEMSWMGDHGDMRGRPELLHPGSTTVISARINYLTPEPDPRKLITSDRTAYVARYALGRDYHKTLRQKLTRLTGRIRDYLEARHFTTFSARVCTDSAPLLEKAIGEKAGLGWIGKNTLLMHESAGSWFFLAEVLTNLPLVPTGETQVNRCGSCSACMDICPTDAIVGPYELDARRCISYLTIEHRGAIDESLRRSMGNRVFGCDDCQVACPWNRYAKPTAEPDFRPRHGLEAPGLIELFNWTEDQFLENTLGSAIRRTGYQGWVRNLAIALGNAQPDPAIVASLEARLGLSDLLDEHITWAIGEQTDKLKAAGR